MVALLALAPGVVHAGNAELALGIANAVEDEDTTGVATLAWVTDAPHPYELQVGHIESRADDGGPVSPTATFIAASKRLTWRRWYVSSGVALTDTHRDNRVLSGAFQFMTGIGWQSKDWSISLRHLSNAGIEGRNHGETYLMLAYAFGD